MDPISDRDRMKDELRHEIMESLQPVEFSRLGLLFKSDPAEATEAAAVSAEHGEHEHEPDGADMHEHMHTFPMFRRDESGEIVEVDLASIQSDTSGYSPTGDDSHGVGGSTAETGEHSHNHG